MEIPRNLYPGTFTDQVKSIAYRESDDTLKKVLHYGCLLDKFSRITNISKKREFKAKKIDLFLENIGNDESLKNAVYRVDQIYTQILGGE